VLSEDHQTLIPPELTLFHRCLGQALSPLLFDFIEDSTIPDCRAASGPNNAMIHGPVTHYVIANTAGGVEINRFERPHEAPAQRQPLAYRNREGDVHGILADDQGERAGFGTDHIAFRDIGAADLAGDRREQDADRAYDAEQAGDLCAQVGFSQDA